MSSPPAPERPRPVSDAARGQLPVGIGGAASPGVLFLLWKLQTEQPITWSVLAIAALLTLVPVLTTAVALRGTVATAEPQVTPNVDPQAPTGERLRPVPERMARPQTAPISSVPELRHPRRPGDRDEWGPGPDVRTPTHRAAGDTGESWPNASRDPGRPVRTPRREPELYGGTEPSDDDWTGAAARDTRRGVPARSFYTGSDYEGGPG